MPAAAGSRGNHLVVRAAIDLPAAHVPAASLHCHQEDGFA